MILQYLIKSMICLSVSMVLVRSSSNPTCEMLEKYGPIFLRWRSSGRTIENLSPYKIIDDLFPENWDFVRFIFPSSLRVWYDAPKNSSYFSGKQMIIDLKTGKEIVNDVAIKKMKIQFFHDFILATMHDDPSIVALSFNPKVVKINEINGISGEVVTRKISRHYPSYSIILNKHCLIGGDSKKSLPMLCYDNSKREWMEDDRIKIKRYNHVSLVHNGILYVCGGFDEGGKPVSNCTLYNIGTGDITEIFPFCGGTIKWEGQLLTVNNEVHYVDDTKRVRIYPPDECVNYFMWSIFGYGQVAVLDQCYDPSPNGVNSVTQLNNSTIWLNTLFIFVMLLN